MAWGDLALPPSNTSIVSTLPVRQGRYFIEEGKRRNGKMRLSSGKRNQLHVYEARCVLMRRVPHVSRSQHILQTSLILCDLVYAEAAEGVERRVSN
jgi:hypothetical protein